MIKPAVTHLIRPLALRAKHPVRVASLTSALLLLCVQAHALSHERIARIDALMSTLDDRGQFNGAILVAQRGEIIYRNGFGKANFQSGTHFTPDTPSNIASVTKPFTAMAVMMLAERNKLRYDDAVSKYLPEFIGSAHLGKITLRHLLTHTSGILDYGDLGIDDSRLDQQGLIRALLNKDAVFARPGLRYRLVQVGSSAIHRQARPAVYVDGDLHAGHRGRRHVKVWFWMECGARREPQICLAYRQ
jgi:CubicO group peptidase (beta-lactamase class C family)